MCACAGTSDRRLRSIQDEARQELWRGEFEHAQTLAEQGLAAAPPGSVWAWTFQLSKAEILIQRRQLAQAEPTLTATLPADAAFTPLRARQKYLVAVAKLKTPKGEAEALAALTEAGRLAPEGSDIQLEIQLIEGQTRLRLSEWEQAERTLMAAIAKAADRGDALSQARGWADLGMGSLSRSRWDESLLRLERVLAFGDLDKTTVSAIALNNAGICYARLGDFERAMPLQRRAVAFYANHGRREDYANALGEVGNTYQLQGETERALPFYQQALTVAKDAKSPGVAATWAGNLAAATIELKHWDEGEQSNEEARRLKTASGGRGLVYNQLNAAQIALGRGQLDVAARLFRGALDDPSGDPGVRWTAHEGLAGIAIARSKPKEAASHFDAALESIEKAQDKLNKIEFKISLLTRLIRFYQSYVDALMDQGRVERALEVADSSRGRVLAARSSWAAPQLASAAELRKVAADSHAVLLSYWLTRNRSYVWVVAGDGIHSATIQPAAEIAALVRDHKALLDSTADPMASAGTPGERLYDMLVEPVSRWIPADSRVILVADGALHGLNFETLTVPRPSPHYWIKDVDLEVAPGLSILSGTRAAAAKTRSLLLIGDAVARSTFPALKYAGPEVDAVSKYFPSEATTKYTGDKATPAAYKSAATSKYSFVHFAAHAAANRESPLDSAVILSGPDNAFKLYARDVADVSLTADLVTVSACRSAGERIYSGEGLVGFAWAFLHAGARRVIAGLWDVDDRSTAMLMDRLYAELAAGRPPGKALRAAKLYLLADKGNYKKPYYWGPFQMFTAVP